LATAALALAGCGSSAPKVHASGAGHPPAAPGSPSDAQFAARADAICSELQAEQLPLRKRSEALDGEASAATRHLLATLSSQTVALARAADARLAALAAPAGERSRISKLLGGYRSEAQDVSELAAALNSGEPTEQSAAAASLSRASSADRALAAQLGLYVCSSA
jgi:hypothetical protein